MPSFDDIDKILNSSGIMVDAVTDDDAADTTTAAPVPSMCLSFKTRGT